jgi:hypothetical protein
MDDDKLPQVNDNSTINDMRLPNEFRSITFSEYKKTQVKTQFTLSLVNNKIEPACYWCSELICAGHFMDVWEVIFHFAGKYIHVGNPKLFIYLEKRYSTFREIMSQGMFLNELQLRNHPVIRQLFAQIVAVLITSNKKYSVEAVKINKQEEYDITQMTDRFIAPNIQYINDIFKKDDPRELFIAANEFAYNVSKDKLNMRNACYWIEWIIEFDLICKKRKQPCFCETRPFVKVETKFRNDCIWILWETLFHYCNEKDNAFISELMSSIYALFCVKYTTASCKRRRYLLYFAVALLTENVSTNIDLFSNKTFIHTVTNNINRVYRQVKKKEHVPTTDYLFNNLEQENAFEQSLRKLQLVNSMDAPV